jgi:hypothetical protein
MRHVPVHQIDPPTPTLSVNAKTSASSMPLGNTFPGEMTVTGEATDSHGRITRFILTIKPTHDSWLPSYKDISRNLLATVAVWAIVEGGGHLYYGSSVTQSVVAEVHRLIVASI